MFYLDIYISVCKFWFWYRIYRIQKLKTSVVQIVHFYLEIVLRSSSVHYLRSFERKLIHTCCIHYPVCKHSIYMSGRVEKSVAEKNSVCVLMLVMSQLTAACHMWLLRRFVQRPHNTATCVTCSLKVLMLVVSQLTAACHKVVFEALCAETTQYCNICDMFSQSRRHCLGHYNKTYFIDTQVSLKRF